MEKKYIDINGVAHLGAKMDSRFERRGNIAPIFSPEEPYVSGAYCIYDFVLYCFTADKTAGIWDPSIVEVVDIGTVLKLLEDNKANIDGAYEQMTVGNAEQLASTVAISDKAPYNFRTSGGSVDIGDRETDKIVGGTVIHNQLASLIASDWTTARANVSVSGKVISVTTTSATAMKYAQFALEKGHKYLIEGKITAPQDYAFLIGVYDGTATNTYSWRTQVSAGTSEYVSVVVVNNYDTGALRLTHTTGTASGITGTAEKLVVYDITAYFGASIADYIYSLEQSTAGSGISWIKSYGFFVKDHYLKDIGHAQSVNVSAHKMTGFNQWNEEWELGGYALSTGAPFNDNTKIRSKSTNYIRVIPGLTYYCKSPSPIAFYWYDVNKDYISRIIKDGHSVFTIPDNAYYTRFSVDAVYGVTYNHDICINLHWDGERDGEYEAHTEHTYPLDSDLTLRGIPKLDASNNLYYDGDEYTSDGTVTRKYGIVDLGTLTWSKDTVTQGTLFRSNEIDGATITTGSPLPDIICSKYVTVLFDSRAEKTISCSVANKVDIIDSAYVDSTVDQFKAAMSGVYLVYKLATPTIESADAYQNPQIVSDWGTEEYVDYAHSQGTRDVAIPVGHNTLYAANLRAKLEMAPNSPDGDGLYLVKQENGINTYVAFIKELPVFPTEDGTYSLKYTKNGSTASLSWVAEV